MKTITIVLNEAAEVSAISSASYMFSMVNLHYRNEGRAEPFNVRLAALTREVKINDGKLIMIADDLLEDVERTDLIIISPVTKDMEQAIRSNARLIEWISLQ